jgi:hypothetical protein
MINHPGHLYVDSIIQHKSSIAILILSGLDVKERFIVCNEIFFGGSC